MQIPEQLLAQLPPLAQTLLPAFRRAFPEVGASERVEEGHLWIVIPARAVEVGPLEIMVDEEEATVHLGVHTHTHISPWSYGDESADPHATVTEGTIDYVAAVLADRVVIWSQYVNGRQVSGGAYDRELAGPTLRSPMAAGYLWSGARHLPTEPRDA